MIPKGFKEIPNYPKYYVSKTGEIFSTYKYPNGKYLTPILDEHGYYRIVVRNKEGKKYTFVHRLVALTYLENNMNYKVVNHMNENRTDNRVENLEWCTHKYNSNYGTRNARISEKMKIACRKRIGTKVVQIDLNDNPVMVWNAIKHADRYSQFNEMQIAKCCKGERDSYKGYKWMFYNDAIKFFSLENVPNGSLKNAM